VAGDTSNDLFYKLSQSSSNNHNDDCYSLDVVFIIDQSDSMGGDAALLPNDPTGQRAYAPMWAIDWLTDNALDICPNSIHRIGVISFGSKANVDLELSEINPSNTEEWSYLRKNFKESISLQSLGQTDPKLAFEKAIDMLNNAAQTSDIPRKRVIVYMTDGMPCVEKLGCTRGNNTMDFTRYALELEETISEELPFDETLLKREKCIQQLYDIYEDEIPPEDYNQCLSDFPVDDTTYYESTYIYSMLLSYGEAWPKELKDIYTRISESHAGRSIDITEKRQDIPGTFLNILTRLSGVPVTRLTCGNFAVNPFVKQARMTFFKLSEDTSVKISYTDKEGGNHEIVDGEHDGGFSVVEHYSEGANERYVLQFPYPGIWRIESDACDGIDAYYEPIQIDMASGLNPIRIFNEDEGYLLPELTLLPEYDREPYYNSDKPYYITYEMRDDEGNIIEDLTVPGLSVQGNVTVTTPEGKKINYDLIWNQIEKKYFTEAPLQLPSEGEYQFSIYGEVPYKEVPYGPVYEQSLNDIYQSNKVLFNSEKMTFSAFKVIALTPKCQADNRTIHKNILSGGWPLELNPVDVEMSFSTESVAIPYEEYPLFPDPENAISVYWQQGERVSEQYMLSPVESQNGLFTGQIPGIPVEGDVDLVFSIVGDYSDRYRFETKEVVHTISQSDGFWTTPTTYVVIMAITVVTLLIFIVICRINSRYPVTGKIQLVAQGMPPKEIYLSGKFCHKNKAVLKRELRDAEYCDIWRMEVNSVPHKKQNAENEDSGFSTYDQEDQAVRVSVKLWLISKKKGFQSIFPGNPDVELELISKGSSERYSDEAGCQIEYI
jgi:hypothetical protein